jgi:uncharacterized phiE125 gp8 family phage protein
MIISKSLPTDGNISFVLYSAPSVEPISVSELKTFARIDGDDENTLLSQFIVAARIAAEDYLKRSLITQTIRATIDFWPESGKIELPRPPLQSITQIATRDEDDALTVYDSDYYYAITESIPGCVVIKKGATNPANYDRDYAGIIIDYVCGYGDRAQDVPEPIRQALYLWTTSIYENRVVSTEPPPEARPLLDIFRVERI